MAQAFVRRNLLHLAFRHRLSLVGITANHVVRAFARAEAHSAEVIAMLRTTPLELSRALIDRDPDLDLATFRVTEVQAVESQASVLRIASPKMLPAGIVASRKMLPEL